MSDPSKLTIEELISSLKQHRDELGLKVHLATAEGKEGVGESDRENGSNREGLRTAETSGW